MNKIYRRLWSTARQCWVVASELSAARGKSSQLVGAGALALALTLSSPGAWAAEEDTVDESVDVPVLDAWALQAAFGSRAAISGAGAAPFADALAERIIGQVALTTDHYYRDSTVDGDLLTVLGSRSTLSGSRSVAYGSVITSRGTNNTAIGYNVQITNGGYATAVGAQSVASGVGTTVLGNNAKAYSENSIAVGSGANTVNSSAGVSRIAIGGNAYAGTAGWSGAVALGGNSRAEYDAVAVGHEARSTAEGALAMGRGAQATAANALAMGKGAKAQTASSLAVGRDAQTAATGSIAIGQGARITDAFAQDSIAIGRGANTQHLSSIALGSGSVTTGNWQVAVGSSSRKRRIVGMEDGGLFRGSDHAVTGGQLFVTNENVTRAQRTADEAAAGARLVTQSSPSSAIRMGAENTGTVIDVANAGGTKRRIQNIANGVLSTGSTDAVTGQQLNATNVEVASVRTTATSAQTTAGAAKTAADNALAKANALGGLVSQTSATSNVRLGGENTGTMVDVRNKSNANRKVTGVAEATLSASSTEAVSGKQLNATNVEVASVRTTATSAQTTAGAAKTAADNALAKANALGGLVSQTSATSNVRLGGENTGTMVDVRNKSNANRKVTGVAEATLSASSTEAVSGKQLNATNTEVASVRSAAANAQTSANVAQTTADSAFAKARATGNAVATAAEVSDANKATATGHLAMAMGNVAKANGVATVAVGNNANAVGTNAISIGSASGATGQFALALGGNAKATHENAVALGEKSVTGGTNQVSIGNATLKRKLVNVADATLSSTSTDAVTGKQVFAVDQKVTANQSLLASHATELTGHEARIAGNRRDLDDLRTEFDNFDPDLEGVVRYAADGSIDMDGGKVRGVAAGDISSAGSTDAVNGGQLFVTNQRLSQVEETARYIAIGQDDESIDAKAGEFSVAIGDGAEAGEGTDGATAIGAFSRARGKGSVALGRASFVDSSAENGFALGIGSSVHSNEGVALGGFARIEAGAEYSVALGASSTATEENVVSVGNLTRKRRIVNLARGRGAEDAVTVGQLGDSLTALGGGAAIDPGGNIILPTYRMQGGSQNNVEDALNVLDGAVLTAGTRVDRVEDQLRSAFQESPATRSDGLGQLNLAGANGMVLGNVANGLIAPGSRDAVNGGQLHAMEQRLDGRIDGLEQRVDATPEGRALASASAPTPPAAPEAEGPAGASGEPAAASAGRAGGGIASADGGGSPAPADAPAPTPQVNTADLEKMLARANEYTDGAISNFERRLDKMDKRFNRMAAMSSAQSAMAMNTAGLATYNRLGAGVGYSDGESALAVGYQRVLNERGSATFSLNGAFTNSGEQSVGLGVGIGW
ncbi:ESPR-type extended signal peptide-containing protein [Stenotrophomonas sp.]|uniref:ESPR-type extended signal peptide-containing protein n=1 Tax=Stenotrophomonas sp. TaxID=69392 RepID=UPI0028AB5185|nr:ESPR-type extended signal peptide-containing protein [Stenotrophomonas sp.]